MAALSLSGIGPATAQQPLNWQFAAPSEGSNFAYNPSGGSWTFNSQSGIAGNGSAFGNATAPLGTQVALLQYTGAMSQAINLNKNNNYSFAFYATYRSGYPSSGHQQEVSVLLNGTNILNAYTPVSSSGWSGTTTSYYTPTSNGPATLTFDALDPSGGDETAFIACVTYSSVLTSTGTQPVANGFFTTPTESSFAYAPVGASWTFGGGAGIAHTSSGFNVPAQLETPSSAQVGFMQGNGSNASISQSVTLPTAGVYEVSFFSAERNEGGTLNNETLNVSLGSNTLVSALKPDAGGATLTYYNYYTPYLSAGSYSLAFTGNVAGDNTAFISQVNMSYAYSPAPAAAPVMFGGLSCVAVLARGKRRRSVLGDRKQ